MKSLEMKIANARRKKLDEPATAMYLEGKVDLCRAATVSKVANGGKGWISLVVTAEDDE